MQAGYDHYKSQGCKNMSIQPHKDRIKQPDKGCKLYKIIPLKYLDDMLEKSYLHFQRVDTYNDDINDSDQTRIDKALSEKSIFLDSDNYSAKDYYDSCRSRTYACCFSTKQTDHLFEHYYNKAEDKAICLAFDCQTLIEQLNINFSIAPIQYGTQRLENFLDINHGLVEYGNFEERFMGNLLPNPIEYVYFKDNKFSEEHEFRTVISTLGMGNIVLPDKNPFQFTESLKLSINLVEAINANILENIILTTKSDKEETEQLLKKYNIDLKNMQTGMNNK